MQYSNLTPVSASYITNSNRQSYLLIPTNENNIPSKTVYDPLYGHITFPKLMWDVIDTPQFQHLRKLHQLSTSYYTFMGVNHTRFEHCLGVGYLSRDLVTRCFNILKEHNEETEIYTQCVSVAGLCHDIGHGPFSHLFNHVLKKMGIDDWDHEKFGGKIIEDLINEKEDLQKEIDEEKLKLINSLIIGDKKSNDSIYKNYDWIFQIISNVENSIDVDKFDYIMRDIYHSGLKTLSVDYCRIFKDINIIDNRICFNEKNEKSLLSLFQSRYCLYEKIYKYKKVLCIEEMIIDAMDLSKDYFKFKDIVRQKLVKEFIKLDDDYIIDSMLHFSDDEDTKNDKNLIKAEEIIKRIYNRDLYKLVGEIPLINNIDINKMKADFLCYKNPKDELYIKNEDIEFRKRSVNFGFGNKNPFNTIYFYNPVTNKLRINKMTHLLNMPEKNFSESSILIFCRDSKKLERAKKMLELLKEKQFNIKKEKETEIEDDKNDNNYNEKENLSTPSFNQKILNAKRNRTKPGNVSPFNEEK